MVTTSVLINGLSTIVLKLWDLFKGFPCFYLCRHCLLSFYKIIVKHEGKLFMIFPFLSVTASNRAGPTSDKSNDFCKQTNLNWNRFVKRPNTSKTFQFPPSPESPNCVGVSSLEIAPMKVKKQWDAIKTYCIYESGMILQMFERTSLWSYTKFQLDHTSSEVVCSTAMEKIQAYSVLAVHILLLNQPLLLLLLWLLLQLLYYRHHLEDLAVKEFPLVWVNLGSSLVPIISVIINKWINKRKDK